MGEAGERFVRIIDYDFVEFEEIISNDSVKLNANDGAEHGKEIADDDGHIRANWRRLPRAIQFARRKR